MENIMESKFMQVLRRFGEALASNKVLSTLSGSMMGMMAVIMVGAIFQIFAILPTLFGWTTSQSAYYQIMMVPYNMTMGLMSVALAFSLGYVYAKGLGLKPLSNGVTAMLLFLMVAAPVQTVALAGGGTFTGLDSANLGAVGMFTAILVSIVSVRVVKLCEEKQIAIKMPDVVPQFLADSFTALLPFFFNVILWQGVSTLSSTYLGVTLPNLVTKLLAGPLAALNSVPGMLILLLLACVMWFFGIHGSMVVYSALMPVLIQNVSANAAAVAAGQEPVFYATSLLGAMACAGGTGNTFSAVLLGLRSKSEQLRAVAKAALVPGVFNINEPVTFGYPVMYNPIMAIPYIINPILTALVLWLGYSVGFFKPGYIAIMSVMPLGVGEFLGALAWQNLFIPVTGIVVSGLCYYPFFKVYEKQLAEKEAAAKMAAD